MKATHVAGALVVVAVTAACSRQTTQGEATATTTTAATTTTEQVTTTTIRRLGCVEYLGLVLLPIIQEVQHILDNENEFRFALMIEEITFDEGADRLTVMASDIGGLIRRLDDIGDPPEQLSRTVRLMRELLIAYEESLRLQATGLRTSDVALIEQGMTHRDNSNSAALVEEFASALDADEC